MPFWSLTTYSAFPTDQTLHQFYELDNKLETFYTELREVFHRAFATNVACQQGTLTIRAYRSVSLGTCVCSCWREYPPPPPQPAMIFFWTFHLEYSSVLSLFYLFIFWSANRSSKIYTCPVYHNFLTRRKSVLQPMSTNELYFSIKKLKRFPLVYRRQIGKREEIRCNRMTNTPKRKTIQSQCYSDSTKLPDNTTIMDRLRTVSWRDNIHQTSVVRLRLS